MIMLTLYRSPKQSSVLLPEFSEFLSITLTGSDWVILIGAMNIHINNIGDSEAMEFMNNLDSLGLTQHVTEATH